MKTTKLHILDSDLELVVFNFDNEPLLTIHKKIFALSLSPQHLIPLPKPLIQKLNQIISNSFTNAFCHLTLYKGIVSLKLGQEPLLDITTEDTFTLQGRSFEDFCLKIINLDQNYRWVLEHNYSKIA